MLIGVRRFLLDTCRLLVFFVVSGLEAIGEVFSDVPQSKWKACKESFIQINAGGSTPLAVVTGGNGGIGKECVYLLARSGYRVIIACRSKSKGELAREDVLNTLGRAASDSSVVVELCDMCDQRSVRSFCERVTSNYSEQLEVIICNAGVMAIPPQLSPQNYEMQTATNHLGHYLMLSLFQETLLKSEKSKVVIVSSGTHLWVKAINQSHFHPYKDVAELDKVYHRYNAYPESKLYNLMTTHIFHEKWQGKIKINTVHPGAIMSSISFNIPVLGWVAKHFAKFVLKTATEGGVYVTQPVLNKECEQTSGEYFDRLKLCEHHKCINPLSIEKTQLKLLASLSNISTEA